MARLSGEAVGARPRSEHSMPSGPSAVSCPATRTELDLGRAQGDPMSGRKPSTSVATGRSRPAGLDCSDYSALRNNRHARRGPTKCRSSSRPALPDVPQRRSW
jgi:hypothetical protein